MALKELRIKFHRAAAQELQEIAAYYDNQMPGLGREFLAEVQRASDILIDNPELGGIFFEPYRRLVMRRFPFNIYYRTANSEIRILAIAHQHRKVGYWTSRV